MSRSMSGTAPQARLVVQMLLHVGETTYQLGDAEFGYEIPALRALLASSVVPEAAHSLPSALREQPATLCVRLGIAEPRYSQLDQDTANALLTRLQAEEEDLLRTAEGAYTAPSPESSSSSIDKALLRQLKERWRTRFGTEGPVEEVRRAWESFKQEVCGKAVVDRAMSADQYEKLLAMLTASRERTRV